MKCLDDCHNYLLKNYITGEVVPGMPFLPTYQPLRFYEMKEDGTKIAGVTNEEVINVLIHRLKYLNKEWQGGKFKCEENDNAIFHLERALRYLEKRIRNRETRKVEGTHNP